MEKDTWEITTRYLCFHEMKCCREEINVSQEEIQIDPKFQEDYNIQQIISKSYEKESQPTPKNDREWYLPHHRVYHPNKPDKIRVVFNCSANKEFVFGCINKELIPGPDFTDHFVGVLTRFRENKVALMANIEKMYFQIFVSEEH